MISFLPDLIGPLQGSLLVPGRLLIVCYNVLVYIVVQEIQHTISRSDAG